VVGNEHAGAAGAYVAARYTRRGVLSNFYPLYDGRNDQVDRVSAVYRPLFQRMFPRYELSTSDTRDTGLGPAFIQQNTVMYGSRSSQYDGQRAGSAADSGSASGHAVRGTEARGRAAGGTAGASSAERAAGAASAGPAGAGGPGRGAGVATMRPREPGWLPEGVGTRVDLFV
jgi:hypothetical protein